MLLTRLRTFRKDRFKNGVLGLLVFLSACAPNESEFVKVKVRLLSEKAPQLSDLAFLFFSNGPEAVISCNAATFRVGVRGPGINYGMMSPNIPLNMGAAYGASNLTVASTSATLNVPKGLGRVIFAKGIFYDTGVANDCTDVATADNSYLLYGSNSPIDLTEDTNVSLSIGLTTTADFTTTDIASRLTTYPSALSEIQYDMGPILTCTSPHTIHLYDADLGPNNPIVEASSVSVPVNSNFIGPVFPYSAYYMTLLCTSPPQYKFIGNVPTQSGNTTNYILNTL